MVDLKKLSQVSALIKKKNIQFVSLKFNYLFGRWIHFTIPVARFTPDLFRQGIAYDGSSIAGFQTIDKSDMLLMPDIDTVFIDPIIEHPTMSIICDTFEPYTMEPYWRDPRHVAIKTEMYLKKHGVDHAYFGPEIESPCLSNICFISPETNSPDLCKSAAVRNLPDSRILSSASVLVP